MSKKKKRQSFTVRDCLTIMGFLVIFFFFTIGNINENTTEHVGKLALSDGNDPSAVDKPQLLFFSWKNGIHGWRSVQSSR